MIPRKEWKITRIFCQGHRSSFSWAHFLFYVTLDWSPMYDTVLVSFTWYYIIKESLLKIHISFIFLAGFHCNSLNYQVVDQECGFSNENQIKSQLRYNRQTHLAQSQQVDWIQSWDCIHLCIPQVQLRNASSKDDLYWNMGGIGNTVTPSRHINGSQTHHWPPVQYFIGGDNILCILVHTQNKWCNASKGSILNTFLSSEYKSYVVVFIISQV